MRNEPTHIIYFGHRIEIQPEVIADRKAYNNEWYHEWRKSATKDDIEVFRAKRRNHYRVLKSRGFHKVQKKNLAAELSAEQLETRRTFNREYKRKQRQREQTKKAKTAEPIADMDTALKELSQGTAMLRSEPDMDTALKELAQGTAMLRWEPLAAAIAAL